jgi:hypothetical protein
MSVDVKIKVHRNESQAAWEAEAQAQAKSERQLARNAAQFKTLETAAGAYARKRKRSKSWRIS